MRGAVPPPAREAALAGEREFLANASHQLRTPLAAIRGCVETLADGAIEDPKNRLRFVQIIARHAARLETLVEEMLRVVALGAPRRRVRPASILLREFTRRSWESLAPLARRKRLKTALRIPPGLRVRVDREDLRQVLQNLGENAVAYNRYGGSIHFGARAAGGWVQLTVSDTGIGVPRAERERVFERFYRGARARRIVPDGTGLGLSIVKAVAEVYGGRAWAESAPGEGAAVHVTLPRA